jgi:hypothetical protein
MAEHAAPARKPAAPAVPAKAPAAARPEGLGEVLNRRSEAALAGCAQLLADRAAANPLTVPLRAPGPQPVQLMPNRTGLPDGLKSGVEALSGLSMDDVRVHRNSSAPAKLGALAYAQGSDIHLGPGQDRHLPHEAWHVVQQKQGRVRATMQMKDGIGVNDDSGLEREADLTGSRAAAMSLPHRSDRALVDPAGPSSSGRDIVQRNPVVDRQTAELAHSILARYPPDRHHYIGLGRSPTPVMAYIHAMARHNDKISASNLPLSKFSPSEPSFFGGNQPNMAAPLTKDETERLHGHFDNFVPDRKSLDGRSVVLMDFVTSGRSLLAAKNHLGRYLQQRDGTTFSYGPEVKALPLAASETMVQTRKQMQQIGLKEMPMAVPGKLSDDSLAGRMGREEYKPEAEYGAYKVTDPQQTSEQLRANPNPAYGKLVEHYDRHLRGAALSGPDADDPLLGQFVHPLPAPDPGYDADDEAE